MKSPIYILGINESHCSTAVLLKDGGVVAMASEERFTKIKNQTGLPINAIKYCLKIAGIKNKDLDAVYISFLHNVSHQNPNHILSGISNLIQDKLSLNPKLALGIFNLREGVHTTFFLRSSQKKHLQDIAYKLNINAKKIHLVDHETAHAYSSYYSSPVRKNKALVITVDGAGDFACSKIFKVDQGKWIQIASTPNTSSIGMLYYYVTKYLGMKPNEHEYKVMGLAPYSKPAYSKSLLTKLRSIYKVENLYIKSSIPHVSLEKYLEKELKNIRFDVIASATQTFTEEILVNLIKNAIKKTGIRNIYLAGGVFMNVKANMLIANLTDVDFSYFVPSSSDESTAIGAAYFGADDPKPLNSIYTGPSYSEKYIKGLVKKFNKKKFKVTKITHEGKVIAKLIKKGQIVARFSGRMEFGQRALGNRSILARPDNPEVIKIINEQIKGRDFWMPFAPVILRDRIDDYIINPKKIDSPYMMIAFQTTQLAKKELVAGLHPYDLTTRPQILGEDQNPNYYKIIKEFEKLTGIGALLNTSFNLHGMPIVCSPEDAVFTFLNSGLKFLQLENYLIEKL